MTKIENNLFLIKQSIQEISSKYHKTAPKLLAVSKTKPHTDVIEAYNAGQRDFGENYVQEAIAKKNLLKDLSIAWHFIGQIQSNKAKLIAENFDYIHSIDSLKIAKKISTYANKSIKIFLQVNIDDEESKAGFNKESVLDAAFAINTLPNLDLIGLMCIPKTYATLQEQRAVFNNLFMLQEEINQKLNLNLKELSMGMSGDIEAAIAENTTFLRVGSSIFGAR